MRVFVLKLEIGGDALIAHKNVPFAEPPDTLGTLPLTHLVTFLWHTQCPPSDTFSAPSDTLSAPPLAHSELPPLAHSIPFL